MKLSQIFFDLDKKFYSKTKDFCVTGITCNSENVSKGYIFVAIKGLKQDGHKYISAAISKGAKVIIKQGRIPSQVFDNDILFIRVKDTRKELSAIASKFYQEPSRKLKITGITGTNGKTTTSLLIEKIFSEAGLDVGLIGTLHYKYKGKVMPAVNTTPDSLTTHSLLSKMNKQKIGYCVMEVSSHSLDQSRVAHIDFNSAIFTNLTQDHLDYHVSLKKYFLAKQKLFKNLKSSAWAIVNKDDIFADKILRTTKANKLTYGIKKNCDIRAKKIRLNLESSFFYLETPKGNIEIQTALIGYHNIYNILAAVGACLVANIDLAVVSEAIKKLKVIPGRLESIRSKQPFKVFVDYAHTDDALRNVLSILKKFSKKRIILVFGCGGDRDKGKRAKMGKIASQLADYVIVTSDNPRSEDPSEIISGILKGINTKKYKVVIDRFLAIQQALNLAKEQDIVLIAGKGHEAFQIYRDKVIPFDDRKVARKILKCLA